MIGSSIAVAGLALIVVFGASSASANVPTYTLSIIAGTGSQGTPTVGSATLSDLNNPSGVAVDSAGNIYIADWRNYVVEKVDSAGQLTIVAGDGSSGTPVPGPDATLSPMGRPTSVALDAAGNLYIGDGSNGEVLKVDSSGALSVFAGGGATVPTTTPIAATSADTNNPQGLLVDSAGDVFISTDAYQVYKVDPSGNIVLYAGNGGYGATTPGVATSADLYGPVGMAMDAAGNLYIAVQYNYVVAKVDPSGNLTVVAGTGTFGAATQGVAATSSDLEYPVAVAITGTGNLLIADSYDYQVDEVDSGVLSFIAGDGTTSTATAGPALNSAMYQPDALAVNPVTGEVYVANGSASQIVKLTPPQSVPGAPTALQVAPASSTAVLTFSPPVFTSGLPIASYQYSIDGGSTWQSLTYSGSTTITGTITGLDPTTNYQIEVRATNSVGSGPGSAPVSLSRATVAHATLAATGAKDATPMIWFGTILLVIGSAVLLAGRRILAR
jgi:hypothetical protein